MSPSRERAVVGDAVADHLVDRGAQRLGEVPPVVERARVGAAGDGACVARRSISSVVTPGSIIGAEIGQDVGRLVAGAAHAFDDVG